MPSWTSCAPSRNNCDEFLLELEAKEKLLTNIPNLRVQFNKVHGFYIEITNSYKDMVPARYQRRQTLKNAERYITPELKAFEDKALSAQERALQREKFLYEQMLDQLQPHVPALTRVAQAHRGAGRAVLAGRALAHPELVRAAVYAPQPCIEIEAGRHPVVEARLAKPPAAASSPTTPLERQHAHADHHRPEHGR